ncbi:hypothetical protein [Truepera radiovictrix]|uniref:Uncharacterized protein n=1 Tax=Truepera radiovictrix (strain DSM 17093 / CIP 108686 / LMG 22925 / RQ-24) TaxID=649638 RepID=D7CTQ5_TRURR|nr:hypothetical protein [Truepera radiovictrix]ADI15602.1 hypothetical protein Trad_2494 [Truepera radiovictrix DSM 17093]WMT58769.1 hypothetical protein RCV51_07430 [Truepera radiovictrix]
MHRGVHLWTSRFVRRISVVGTYVSYLLLVLLWEPSKALGGAGFALLLLLGLLTVLGYVLICVFQLVLLWPQPGGMLDERQLAVRDRAFRVSFWVLSASVLFAALYGYLAADSGLFWLPQTSSERQAVFWGVWLFVTTLPAAVLCWLEPDVPFEPAP